MAFDSHSTRPPSSMTGTLRLGFILPYSGVSRPPYWPPTCVSVCGSASSRTAQTTFCTFTELRRPQIFSMMVPWSAGREHAPGESGRAAEARPIESRARVRLAAGRDVLVAPRGAQRIARAQHAGQLGQGSVLRVGVGQRIGAFQLDAQRKIVAALARAEARDAGMPGARLGGHELHDGAVAAHEKMRRHAQPAQAFQ